MIITSYDQEKYNEIFIKPDLERIKKIKKDIKTFSIFFIFYIIVILFGNSSTFLINLLFDLLRGFLFLVVAIWFIMFLKLPAPYNRYNKMKTFYGKTFKIEITKDDQLIYTLNGKAKCLSKIRLVYYKGNYLIIEDDKLSVSIPIAIKDFDDFYAYLKTITIGKNELMKQLYVNALLKNKDNYHNLLNDFFKFDFLIPYSRDKMNATDYFSYEDQIYFKTINEEQKDYICIYSTKEEIMKEKDYPYKKLYTFKNLFDQLEKQIVELDLFNQETTINGIIINNHSQKIKITLNNWRAPWQP